MVGLLEIITADAQESAHGWKSREKDEYTEATLS